MAVVVAVVIKFNLFTKIIKLLTTANKAKQ
jgi:hypothetical protein